MMEAFSAMGGELFVMDDGWFGNKYPRNGGNSSLGDWEVCKEKNCLKVLKDCLRLPGSII